MGSSPKGKGDPAGSASVDVGRRVALMVTMGFEAWEDTAKSRDGARR